MEICVSSGRPLQDGPDRGVSGQRRVGGPQPGAQDLAGTLDGEKVSVTSAGMGCPSTAIALEELIKIGAGTFIRIGTAGRVSQKSEAPFWKGGIRICRPWGRIECPAVADRRAVDAWPGLRPSGVLRRRGVF
ncbi:MAG: hypothetical protein LBP23_06545 [Treponema sp.]|nr:hypothetical protein [Treponema sp.]